MIRTVVVINGISFPAVLVAVTEDRFLRNDSAYVIGPGEIAVGHGAYLAISGEEERPAGLMSGFAMAETLRIEQEKLYAKADRLLEFARCWQCPGLGLFVPDNVDIGGKDYFDGLREEVPLEPGNWDTWASCALSEASWISGDELESVPPPVPIFTVSKEAARRRMKNEVGWNEVAWINPKKAKRKARKT